tara:strand:- start:209 stop:613 length:405 start_codon:yes stop_codon:yes gene_type:complete
MKEVAKIVIYDKEKFLLQLRDNKPSINYPDTWSFFGGEVDRGEKHDVALIRELKEELFWTPNSLNFLTELLDRKTNCRIFFFISKFEGKKNQLRLGEGQEMRWFTFHEILSLSDHGFKVGHNVIQVLNIAKSKI